MRIGEDIIEEIRTAADIVDVISGFVRLRKAGRNFIGLCPFHQEKTPSFNVNPEKGFYRCFGCGKGGSVFTFLMEMEKMTFVEAVRAMGQRYGIAIPEEEPRQGPADDTRDLLHEANALAARFFFDALRSPAGTEAMKYLAGRAWTPETLTAFGVGHAPDSWDQFLTHARARGLREDVLEQAGLVVRNDAGRVYDRFRGRIMFPIIGMRKRVLGFGARAMRPGDNPKYLNSPESPVYVKSRVLYGLPQALNAIRSTGTVIVVEGYADTISLAQAGVTNVVATSGTALTTDQVRMLVRYTTQVYFLYDADSAGFNAMIRGVDIMIEQGCDPKIVRLPAGDDPDSFVRRHGRGGVERELAAAVSFVDFILARQQQEGRLATPEGSAEAVRHIVSLLAKMQDQIKRQFYISQIAEKYNLRENMLYSEMEKLRPSLRRSAPVQVAPRNESVDDVQEEAHGELPPAERTFLESLFQASPDVGAEALRHVRVRHFTDSRAVRLLRLALDQFEQEGAVDVRRMTDALGGDIELQHLLAALILPRNVTSPKWPEFQTVHDPDHRKALVESYGKILECDIERKIEVVKRTIRDVEADPERVAECQRMQKQRMEQLRAVKAAKSFEVLVDIMQDEEGESFDF